MARGRGKGEHQREAKCIAAGVFLAGNAGLCHERGRGCVLMLPARLNASVFKCKHMLFDVPA